MKVLAVIPARGKSKGLPGKNIKDLNGKPLIVHSIEVALASRLIDRVVVSTDDQNIARISEDNGADIPYLRPADISGDNATDQEYLRHAIGWFKQNNEDYDVVVLLRPTNLFRTAGDIDEGIKKLLSSDFDSIRGISPVSYPPYWMKKKEEDRLVSFIDSEFEYSRRQSLPETFQANGAVDILRSQVIMNHKNIYGEYIGYIEMDEKSRTDIDNELDFLIADFLHKNLSEKK